MNASALSARALLSRLDGAEREDLQRAMQSQDFATIRAIMARHTDGARIEREGNAAALQQPQPMMRGTSAGARRRAFKPSRDESETRT